MRDLVSRRQNGVYLFNLNDMLIVVMRTKYTEDQLSELMSGVVKDEINGYTISYLNESGSLILDNELSSHLFGNAWFDKTEVLVLPVNRLPQDFFSLSTGQAGEIIRKSTSYNIILVIIGDIELYKNRSPAVSALVSESNKGEHVWFLKDKPSVINKFTSHRH